MRKLHHTKKSKVRTFYRINRYIHAPKVRLVNENGQNVGIVPTSEALAKAQEKGYDLVEISPKAEPPVAKFLNYSQFKYEQSKKKGEQRVKQKKTELKGIRLSLRISKHDLQFRLNRAQKFLEGGNKIKIEMVLKGRERQHMDLAQEIINKFISNLGEEILIEQPLTRQGGRLTIIINKK